jgi:quercetin dioxygenase-like cupin family protein
MPRDGARDGEAASGRQPGSMSGSPPDMNEPVVVRLEEREWEAWPDEQVPVRGPAEWKTLISAGLTPSEGLTLGVARLPAGGSLHRHHHAQPEAYFVLEGTGIVTIDGGARAVAPGAAVFIPGNAVHSVTAAGETDLRLAYVLAADAFDDVEYVFDE